MDSAPVAFVDQGRAPRLAAWNWGLIAALVGCGAFWSAVGVAIAAIS